MEIRCTQCGATLEVAPDRSLLQCDYCATALVVDQATSLFHEIMAPMIDAAGAQGHLRRFMAGTQTVADLDRKATIQDARLEYFPFWAFTIREGRDERVVLEPALPSALIGLQGLDLPPGETQPAAKATTGGVPIHEPEVPRSTAQEWLKQRHPKATVRKTVLYHLPLFRFRYTFKDREYSSAVEAISGKVFPADFPSKAEAPFIAVATIALIVFGLEGLVFQNLFIKALAYLVSAIPILGLAWLTSKKV